MIERNPKDAANCAFDMIIVGGGIHGVALTLEAALRGLRPLLLEKDDFGGATSWNTLRIIHGGFRYLQSLDIRRHRESVRERNWLLRTFPEQVVPFSCLMPLYNRGIRRRSILRLGLAANDLLSLDRNHRLEVARRLPRGRILSARQTVSRFPGVEIQGLKGSALWYDARVETPQRLLIEMLHWSADRGAVALNYMKALARTGPRSQIDGVRAMDQRSGEAHEFKAPIVVNCAGPWCRQVAQSFDRDVEDMFRPSIAFNLVLDREPLSDVALAVSPKMKGSRSQIYFLCPFKGRILAGTMHRAWARPMEESRERDLPIQSLLEELNLAIPGLDLVAEDVLRVQWGILPASRHDPATTNSREVIVNHSDIGGPKGLFSVSGIKYTTARMIAERTLKRIHRDLGRQLPQISPSARPEILAPGEIDDFEAWLRKDPQQAERIVRRIIDTESVLEVEDLILRRTDWGIDPRRGALAVKVTTDCLRDAAIPTVRA